MSIETRELYASPNGDRWYLVREAQSQQVLVRHVANAASGGHVTHTDVGAFLMRGGHSPEQQALLRLIGTLTEGRIDGDGQHRASGPAPQG